MATNELGSVLGTFSSGGMPNLYRYDPWGVTTAMPNHGLDVPQRFAGQQWDNLAGLYYLRARYYDPEIGRFISQDPLGLAAGLNPYAYAGNDPVNQADPSGMDCVYAPALAEQISPGYGGWICSQAKGISATVHNGRGPAAFPSGPTPVATSHPFAGHPVPAGGGRVASKAPNLPSGFYIDLGALNNGATPDCGADLAQAGTSLVLNLLEVSVVESLYETWSWSRTGEGFAHALTGGLVAPTSDGLSFKWGEDAGSTPGFVVGNEGLHAFWNLSKFVPWASFGTDFVEAIDSCVLGGSL